MRISELFYSIQGEGQFTGTPSVFVRTTGCNLRCWFCDTPETSWSPAGVQQPWKTVLEHVQAYDCSHVVVTGGEPMLQPDVVPLTHALRDLGKFVTIETAGTVYRAVHADLMSVSPKLANSTPNKGVWAERHERLRENHEVAARLFREFRCQLKFVIDRSDDLQDVSAYLSRFPQVSSDCVWLMPQAVTTAELQQKTPWLTTEASQRGYRVSPRLQIELFGNTRGT